MTIQQAALQMMDFLLGRAPGKVAAIHAIVAAHPDFHVSMNFDFSEGPYRGVHLRDGSGGGNTDGMMGSDVYEKVTEDVDAYPSVLQPDPEAMMGPYL
jgi:hypothetical protein